MNTDFLDGLDDNSKTFLYGIQSKIQGLTAHYGKSRFIEMCDVALKSTSTWRNVKDDLTVDQSKPSLVNCLEPHDNAPVPDDKKYLVCQYAALTSLHDRIIDRTTPPIYFTDNAKKKSEVLYLYQVFTSDIYFRLQSAEYKREKAKGYIDCALIAVKADLEQNGGKAVNTNSKTGNEKGSSIYIDKFDNRGGSATFGEKSPIDNSKVTNSSPPKKEPWYKKLHIWLAIVVLLISVLGFFGIKKYTDLFNRKLSPATTIQPNTSPIIKPLIDPNIADVNKPIRTN